MKRIRVCNVDEEGRFGGPERRIVQVAKVLKELGIDTHIVYPKHDSERFEREIIQAGISSTALNITRLSKEKKVLLRYIFLFLTEIYRLYRFFRKHGFDLIHVNGSYQFKVALAARLSGIPTIWHLNDTMMDAMVKRICTVTAKYCASGFIVAGKRVYDFYIRGTELELKPYVEIHAPVDINAFDPDIVRSEERVCKASGVKIVTVAGINPTKGLEYFIRMAENILRRHSDLEFFIAGAVLSSHTRYYEGLKKAVSEANLSDGYLRFVGMVDDVPSFLQGADICVFTSISEASPTAIWEAMSMGKAVVTTDVGSVSQYIEDGVSGFIVPIRDTWALSEKVELLLDNPALRQKMGTAARIVATEKLDISLAAEMHATFYRKIAINDKIVNNI